MDDQPVDILIGLAQHTPPEARGDPGETYHLTPLEKKEHVDGLDDGTIDPLEIVREHAGGENYIPSESNNDYYKVAGDKVMGYAKEGFLDANFNEYLISELKRDHPDTRYVHKVLDNHTDKAGQAPTPGPYRSRIGYSLGTDVVRRRKGPILEKSVGHLGVTEDPLYHDDGHTRIFFRTSLAEERDNWLRENVLDKIDEETGKPKFYLPKNMERRLREKAPANLQRHSIGASTGTIIPASPSNVSTMSRGSDSELATSSIVSNPTTSIPTVQSQVSSPSFSSSSSTPKLMSAPLATTPAVDAMDIATTNTNIASNQAQPPTTTQPPQTTPSTDNTDRARLSGEYQQLLDKASTFVKTPDLTDMKKDDAVEKYAQLYKYKTQLAKLQDELKIPREQETELEIDTRTDLESKFREMGNKLVEEIKESNIVTPAQKPLYISGVKTNPLLCTDQLLSVHANSNAMSNQREAQRRLAEELAETKRSADNDRKKMMDELAEMKKLHGALSDQLSESKKRPREESSSSFQQPLPGSDASPGSLLKKNRTDEGSSSFGGNGGYKLPPSNAPGVKVGNIELPQRFSTGASAGTVKEVSLISEREMPKPVSVKFRDDLHRLPPGEASRQGLTLAPLKLSASEREFYSLLSQKQNMLDSLALVHNDRVHTLREPIGRQQTPF